MSAYAGIGSRRTPDDVLVLMTEIAEKLEAEGWVLRSGHAKGADQAFERGAGENCEIFLPWPRFQSSAMPIAGTWYGEPTTAAFELAALHHPRWNGLSLASRKLHARNSHQILGRTLDDPVQFVICWSDGHGGIEQALRIARKFQIPITNLFESHSRETAESWLAEPW